MSSFFNLLPDGHNVSLEKCGDIVVSPKDNIVALFCHFCSDIFTRLPEFTRHLQCHHSDILPFAKEQNVYSVEELLTQQNNDQDEQFASDSSSSGDSGLPNERDEENDPDQEQPKEGSDGVAACQFNANIMEALAANDVDLNEPSDKSGNGRDLLAEVEAMLFDDGNKADDGIPQASLTKEKPAETNIITESSYCQMETHKDSKGFRQSRRKTEQKTLSICDLKSYSITRMSRKQEMKRMSSVKMRIMRSLQIEEMAAKPLRNPLMNFPSTERLGDNNIKVETSPAKKKPLKEEVKLSSIQETKENQELLAKISAAISEKPQKPSSSLVKPAETFKNPSIYNVPSMTIKSKLESNSKPKKSDGKFVQINKVQTLPGLNIKRENIPNKSTDKQAAQKRSNSEEDSQTMPKKNRVGSYISLKDSSDEQSQKRKPKAESSQCPSNFSLSESVIEFLQSDLGSTSLNGVDSLLQLAMSSENNAPNQEKVEPQFEAQSAFKPNALKDDLTILELVGLPIIHIPTYEDKLSQDAYDNLRERAAKFSHIFRTYDTIWNRRKFIIGSDLAQSLRHQLNLLTQELNRKLELNLSLSELKRLLNLLNIWHAEQIELVYFQKIKFSSNMKYYFQLFSFLPKMNRFLFFCEHCEKILNLETDYKKHLQKH